MKIFGIHFGAMCDPIAEQLKVQGFKYSEKEVEVFQERADAILLLLFAHLISNSEKDKLNKKLFKQIQAHVLNMNKLETVKP